MAKSSIKTYKNTFLTNVICRIDFAPIPRRTLEQALDGFKDQIRNTFPTFEQSKLTEYQTSIQKDQKTDVRKDYPLYIFFDEAKGKRVQLTYNYIFIEYFKYENFTEFKKTLQNIFGSFIKLYKPDKYFRLGLRYINKIKLDKGNPFTWGSYINSSLTYSVNKFLSDEKEDLSRAMTQVVINRNDYNVNLIYGFYNSEFPSKIRRKEFALDFDCYTTDFDENNIYRLITKFNSEIYGLFEKSIKDGLRKKMGES